MLRDYNFLPMIESIENVYFCKFNVGKWIHAGIMIDCGFWGGKCLNIYY